MMNRRGFLKETAGAAVGLTMGGTALAGAAAGLLQIGAAPGKRREVSIGGRRIKTVDVHAHTFVPEVWDLVKDTPLAATAKANLTGPIALGNPQRLIDMDAQGIDYQCINGNAWGYSAERSLARDIVKLQNEKSRSGAPRTKRSGSTSSSTRRSSATPTRKRSSGGI